MSDSQGTLVVDWRSIAGYLGILTIIVVSSLWNYLLFHSLSELFSIVIATSYSVMAWHTRRTNEIPELVNLGIIYVFIAILDLFHTLSYVGMGLFTGYEYPANQLWVAARVLEAVALLAFSFFRGSSARALAGILTAGSAYVAATLASIFWLRVFPACYVAGSGQTAFKVTAEYAVIATLGAAAVALWVRRGRYPKAAYRSIIASIALTMLSELSFTLYISNYDGINMLGHVLKITSFYLIYRSMIVVGLERPHELLYARLKSHEKELAISNETKDTFFSILSHDLKSPLSGIRSAAESLLDNIGSMNKSDASIILEIQKAADASLSLVDKVLVWARCQSGALRPTITAVDLLASIQTQMRILSKTADNKRITVRNQTPAEARVMADADMLDTVVRNLLQNALKFTPAGGRIEVSARRLGPDWILSVKDTGIGIGPEELARLFCVDGHLRGIGTEGERGVGFGLILSTEFVRLMGGKMEATSVEGQGSVFSFHLPAARPVSM
ncbi:MAG: hypothetical protein CVV47_16075 [Spirochaetae bacterium HGW-Spirochaetae-3]|jgi:signal transduction histidine kinase|nr:MAG: hypothetical protein CVV47_16075 [Spirochaetae bacterium HGW-Spirochaetae-3]